MSQAQFNKIPPQCEGVCPLEQEAVDQNGVVLARNCDGPSTRGMDYESRLTVEFGRIIELEETPGEVDVALACTNKGMWLWLQNRKEEFKGRD